MRKVFLDKLPKTNKGGNIKGKLNIDWRQSKDYKVHFIYEDIEGDLLIEDCKNGYLYISYGDIKNFKIKYCHFAECHLGKLLGKMTSDFKIEIGTRLKDDKRDITIIDKKKIENPHNKGKYLKYYKYRCNVCSFDGEKHWSNLDKKYKDELWILESNLLTHKMGCSCCSGNQIVVEHINSIYKTNPWMIPYIGEECAKTHTHNSGDKVQVTCPDCGIKKKCRIATIYIQKSIGCTCGDGYSYGHKYIFNLLTQLKQKFIDNYTFDWCKFYNPFKNKNTNGEYDFIIENMKVIIEADGEFHRRDNNMNRQTAEESKFIDDEKDKLAEQNGYRVIRISDEGDVKQNTINKLNELFNLSKIDWNKCEEFALSNRVKEACEYKRNNPDMTTGDIGKIMNINSNTIRIYLKKGNDLDWCTYDINQENQKSYNTLAKYNREKRSKSIKMFDKNMNLIYMFFSASECERQSKKLFGIYLNHSNISSVCVGKQNNYKEYIFKHTTKEEYQKWLKEKSKLKELHN